MSDDLRPDNSSLDDELARFADQLLAGGGPEKPGLAHMGREHHALEETVVRLDGAFRAAEPDRAMSSRIKANLFKEWQRSGPQAQKPSFWQQRLGLPAALRLQWIVTAAVVGVLVLAYGLAGGFAAPSTGSAGSGSLTINPVWLVGGAIALAGVLALLLWRRR